MHERYVTFHLNPLARFSDGNRSGRRRAVLLATAARQGPPQSSPVLCQGRKAEALDERTVRFDFGDASDRELPLILGLMPILPKHAIDVATFEETSMTAPFGSGPYRVTAVKPGASVTLTRNPDYWGRDLPVNRGLWNFDEIRFDFYREANGQFEAFKRGLYDFRVETEPLRWHDGYDFPAARNGELVRETIKTGLPQPSEFLVFNTRRPMFADIRVREALSLLFDFDGSTGTISSGSTAAPAAFSRARSCPPTRAPPTNASGRCWSRFARAVRADILDGSYRLPATDGSGRDREALRRALALLSQAGYELDGTVLRQARPERPSPSKSW